MWAGTGASGVGMMVVEAGFGSPVHRDVMPVKCNYAHCVDLVCICLALNDMMRLYRWADWKASDSRAFGLVAQIEALQTWHFVEI